jgi:hypothetical protein
MPFQPMRPPQKEVSVEEMWEKIAKHVPPGTIKPQSREVLKWDKPVRTGELSGYMLEVHGRYSITKDASGTEVTYTAWKRATRSGAEVNLGCVTKREEAEALCNEHYQRT